MKQEEKKSVPIDRTLVKEMQTEKVRSGKPIYLQIAEAWELYKRREGHGPMFTLNVDPKLVEKATKRMTPGESICFDDASVKITAVSPGHFRLELVDKAEAESEEVNALRWILANGSEEDRQWITGNLKTFEEAIRSRGGRSFRKRASR